MHFYLCRHGETNWNLENRVQGHTDTPLNAAGKVQAAALALSLRDLGIEAIFSSDLMRALETAKAVQNELKVPLYTSPLLREWHMGDAEGKTNRELLAEYGEEICRRWRSMSADTLDFGFPNGETKAAHRERCLGALKEFALTHGHINKIAVVSHGESIRRVAYASDGGPTEPLSLPNCAKCLVHYDRVKQIFYFHG